MSYVAIETKTNGDFVYATQWRQIRDNWIASAPDIFEQAGDMAAATGADAAAPVQAAYSWCVFTANSAEATGLEYARYGFYFSHDDSTIPDDFPFAENIIIASDNGTTWPGASTAPFYTPNSAGLYLIFGRSLAPGNLSVGSGNDTNTWRAQYNYYGRADVNSADANGNNKIFLFGPTNEIRVLSGARIRKLEADNKLTFTKARVTTVGSIDGNAWDIWYWDDVTQTSQAAIIKFPGSVS